MTDLLVLPIAAAYAALYLAGVSRLHAPPHPQAVEGRLTRDMRESVVPRRPSGGRGWPRHRTAAFLAGLAVAALVLAPPLADRADERLTPHMWQHLALTFAAAPLLVVGAPVALALRATAGAGASHRALLGLVRSPAARVITHPVVTWTAFAGTMAAAHLTGWYDAALRDGMLHALEHAAYLFTAMLFWAPVLGANPLRGLRSWIGRTIYLVLAMIPMSAVAVLLIYAQHPRYPTYVAREHGAAAALIDQQDAGDVMWVAGSLAMVAATVAIGGEALIREERRQRAIDALEDATAGRGLTA